MKNITKEELLSEYFRQVKEKEIHRWFPYVDWLIGVITGETKVKNVSSNSCVSGNEKYPIKKIDEPLEVAFCVCEKPDEIVFYGKQWKCKRCNLLINKQNDR